MTKTKTTTTTSRLFLAMTSTIALCMYLYVSIGMSKGIWDIFETNIIYAQDQSSISKDAEHEDLLTKPSVTTTGETVPASLNLVDKPKSTAKEDLVTTATKAATLTTLRNVVDKRKNPTVQRQSYPIQHMKFYEHSKSEIFLSSNNLFSLNVDLIIWIFHKFRQVFCLDQHRI